MVMGCSKTRKAVIFDPAPGSAEPINAYLTEHQLTPEIILLTHSHWDHIADVAALKTKWQIPVAVHSADAPNLERPGADGLPTFLPIQGVTPDRLLSDGEEISVGSFKFRVIHTPGHSVGSVCFYEPGLGLLISGDTLFKGTIGNLSFPTSRPDEMWSSLEKLQKLDPSTKVFPGHGPDTVLSLESWLPRAKELFGEE